MSKSQFQKEYEEYQKYKEWQESLCCKNAQEVIDFVMSNYLTEDEKCKTIAEQSQRIADLEEQLKNSVRPKFKVNDKIFVIVNDKIEEYYIDEVLLKCKGTLVAYRDICKETTITEKNEMFATKEEALAKLEELKGD